MGCEEYCCTSIPPQKPSINNPEFTEISEIETELFKSFDIEHQDENKKDFEGFRLNYLSKYYLYATKDEISTKYSNQIIMITGKDINPLKLKENNNLANQKDILKSKEIITKYENKIIPISSHLNLMQHIFPEYQYTFKLNSNSQKEKIIDFNKCYSLIFILFNQKQNALIKKIKEIKNYEEKIKEQFKENIQETFELILMVKENKKELHDYLISNNINDFYILTNKEKDIMEAFGLNDVKSSKCIFYNKSSEISLILEENIEYLTEEMIEYYLGYSSKQEYNNYNNKNKENFKKFLEYSEFKNILKKFTKEFNLEIEFRDIGKKKYPVNIRFKYHEIDKEIAFKEVKKELEEILKNHKIKLYFISELVEEGNANEKLEILKRQSIEKDKKYEELTKKLEEEKKIKEEDEKRIKKLEKEKKEYSEKIKNLEKEKEKYKKKINKLDEEKQEYLKKIKELEKQKQKLDEGKQEYLKTIKELEKDKKEKEEYSKKIKKLKKEKEECTNKIKKLEEDKDEYKTKIKMIEEQKKNSRILIIKTNDENIYCCIEYQITDNFSKLEDNFFKKYPQYKCKKYSFCYNNNTINPSDNLQKLNIQNNEMITLQTII